MSDVLRQLHRELRAHQRRLGTPAEQPDDFDRVLEIAHAINNRLTAILLAESFETESEQTVHAAYRKHLA